MSRLAQPQQTARMNMRSFLKLRARALHRVKWAGLTLTIVLAYVHPATEDRVLKGWIWTIALATGVGVLWLQMRSRCPRCRNRVRLDPVAACCPRCGLDFGSCAARSMTRARSASGTSSPARETSSGRGV